MCKAGKKKKRYTNGLKKTSLEIRPLSPILTPLNPIELYTGEDHFEEKQKYKDKKVQGISLKRKTEERETAKSCPGALQQTISKSR